jgi:signal transduction histidine kinase
MELLELDEQALSNITHDLRAPLSAIMGYLDLVSRQVGPTASGKATEYLSLAREAGRRMSQMVNDMLDMYRLESGVEILQKQRISLSVLFESLQKTFSGMADLKGIRLHFELSNPLLQAWADPRCLGRVLDNLVANALKFTPSGGTIQVKASHSAGHTCFEVSDTGRGIPRQELQRIFNRYHQVRPADRYKGHGMGLAVVKKIVESHDGQIQASSRPGKGSRFLFELPCAPVAHVTQDPQFV